MKIGKKIIFGISVAAISVSALAGGTATQYGNGTYYSDGTSSTRYGNGTYYSR